MDPIMTNEEFILYAKEQRLIYKKKRRRRTIWIAILMIIAVMIPTAFVAYYFGIKIELIFEASLLYGMLVQGATPIILDWIEGL